MLQSSTDDRHSDTWIGRPKANQQNRLVGFAWFDDKPADARASTCGYRSFEDAKTNRLILLESQV
jgi:hypothetical protein